MVKPKKRKSGRFEKGNSVGKSTRFRKGRSGNPTGQHSVIPGKVDLTAHDLGLLTRLASLGVRECDLRRAMRVTETTWRGIKLRDARVTDAIDEGKQCNHDPLWRRMYEKALGGDFMALAYCLNTRYGYRTEDQTGPSAHVVISIPGPSTAKLVEGDAIPMVPTSNNPSVAQTVPLSHVEREPIDVTPVHQASEYAPPPPSRREQMREERQAAQDAEYKMGIDTSPGSFTKAEWARWNK